MREDLRRTINEWYSSLDRKAKGAFIRKAQMKWLTFYEGMSGKRCSARTALLLATAYGTPKRWPELVVIPDRLKKKSPGGSGLIAA